MLNKILLIGAQSGLRRDGGVANGFLVNDMRGLGSEGGNAAKVEAGMASLIQSRQFLDGHGSGFLQQVGVWPP